MYGSEMFNALAEAYADRILASLVSDAWSLAAGEYQAVRGLVDALPAGGRA